MMLTFTHYVDAAPHAVQRSLAQAISASLDAAAGPAGNDRQPTSTTTIDRGMRVDTGLTTLDGTEIRIGGSDRLATLEVAVPWTQPDEGSPKLWAAVRFAAILADEVCVAA